jgi:hypothetical protein
VASATPLATTRYSASTLERETTGRSGCPQGTRHSPTWSNECPGSQPSRHRCRRLGRSWTSDATASRSQASHEDSTRCASWPSSGAPVVHVQADLLHDISDVGPCERQVLEGSGNAPQLRGVRNRWPRVLGTELSLIEREDDTRS